MLTAAIALATVAAACGSLNDTDTAGTSGRATASPFVGATPDPSPSVSAVAAASATAIVASIVPITSGPPRPTPTPPTPTPTPSPVPGGLTQAQLKYRLVDQFGRLLFCDPDFFPIARADEQAQADAKFTEIQRDAPTFAAVLTHLGIAPAPSYTPAQRLAIYRDWKMLNALALQPQGAVFHFVAIFAPSGTQQGSRVDGTIDGFGQVSVASRTPSGPPPCPICLARGTRIATPNGEVPVEELRAGDIVWTIDERGVRVPAPLLRAGSTPVPPTHQVVRVVLDDGRVVLVSPGHPTVDGRLVGELARGDALDGARVVSATRVNYDGGATFDILPAGATGAYWGDGVPLGSTLR